MLEEKYDKV